MATTRGLERLIFFTDAVVAIAITLLILPVVDAVPEAAASNTTVSEFLLAHLPQILTFLLSFVVIARLWISHHAIFEHVAAYNRRLMFLSQFWALTIVFMPLPTALTAFSTDGLTVGLYIGTMLLSSVILSAIVLTVHGNPALEDKENPIVRRTVVASVTTTIAFALAFVIGTLVPAVNYWSLLVLLFGSFVEPILMRTRQRRESHGGEKAAL